MKGGRNRVTREAGTPMTATESTANTTIRISGRTKRGRLVSTGGLVPRLGERDVGIHDSRLGGAIHGNGFDRETVALLERGKPGDQNVERRRFQLDAYAGAARLRSAQRAAETGLSADAVHEHHRRLSGVPNRCAARLDLRRIHAYPRQILAPRLLG